MKSYNTAILRVPSEKCNGKVLEKASSLRNDVSGKSVDISSIDFLVRKKEIR